MCYTIRSFQKAGSAHRHCQDRFRITAHKDRLILVTADGHGGAPYTRSSMGARFACKAASELLATELPAEQIPGAIKSRYDALVARHLLLRPLKPWELERLAGRPPEAAYGTTLLAVRACAQGTEVFQLGDGQIALFAADGSLLPALPEDDACLGNLTSSLCSSRDTVLARFRHGRYPAAAGILLFTDGCEGGLIQAAAGLAALPELDDHLASMLQSTDRGDDQTCLAAFVPETVETPEFQEGLLKTLDALRAAARQQRQATREQEEYEQLKCFLALALRKARRMPSEEAADYLRHLEPSFARYQQLCKIFSQEE